MGVARRIASSLGDFGKHSARCLSDSRLAARRRYLLSGSNVVLIHRRATGRAFEPLLLGILARQHAGKFPARRAERIGLVSARFAEPEAGGCSVGDDVGAMEADDLTTFALSLIAEGAQVLVANAAGSNWQRGVSLAAVILHFDRLVDAAIGAGDGVVGAAANAEPVRFKFG